MAALGQPSAEAQENVVQEFSGSGTTTTGFFKVKERWEVRWNARQVVSVAVMSTDGTIVAGAAGVLRGSLFVPWGGQYYFKISDGTVAPPAVAATNAASGTNASSASPPPEPAASWHLQVIDLGMSVASSQALTVYTPYFMVPDSAITPAAPLPRLPPPSLTDDQIRTMVTIKGDNAQGAGFLLRSPDGTFVATHLQLLAANPHVKIFTNSGAPVTVLALKGATDRDLALFTIQDDHYSYLNLPADTAHSVATGDQVLIPDIGQPTGALLGKTGKVIGVGPLQIDFDNALGPGCGGSPVIHVKSGNVIALVTARKKVDLSDTLAAAWPANPAPGSAGIIPYFGLRLTGVPNWEIYDQARFLTETLFLKQFHEDTRCLDSYLNGKRRRPRSDGDTSGPPDNRYFLNNSKLSEAHDSYKQLAANADDNQRLDAARELLSDLEGIANTGMDTLQNSTNLYASDRTCAKEELAYRQALQAELDDLSNNIARLDHIARSR